MRAPLRWITNLAVGAALVLGPVQAAAAPVRRLALIVGNNRGIAGETLLRYAERDAQRVAEILRSLGEFASTDIVTLLGGKAAEMRGSLQQLAGRARGQREPSFIFVYYSGHASSEALHLGGTELPLAQLVSDLEATGGALKVLVLDACRSGSVTRVKGASQVPEFSIDVTDRLDAEGTALLTSSAAGENSQESEELEASFFTHHFASALVGAGDGDGDGRVSLNEAFRYAAQQTLKSTAATLAGPQHPTFRFELGGRGDVILTQPSRRGLPFARLQLSPVGSFLVRRTDSSGAVIAEVVGSGPRWLTLPAGGYYVMKREVDHYREAQVTLAEGTETLLSPGDFVRREYSRRISKAPPRYPQREVEWNFLSLHLNLIELGYAEQVQDCGALFGTARWGYGPLTMGHGGVELGLRGGARYTLVGDPPEGLYAELGLSALYWNWFRLRAPAFIQEGPFDQDVGVWVAPGVGLGLKGVFFKRWVASLIFSVEYLFPLGGSSMYTSGVKLRPGGTIGVAF